MQTSRLSVAGLVLLRLPVNDPVEVLSSAVGAPVPAAALITVSAYLVQTAVVLHRASRLVGV